MSSIGSQELMAWFSRYHSVPAQNSLSSHNFGSFNHTLIRCLRTAIRSNQSVSSLHPKDTWRHTEQCGSRKHLQQSIPTDFHNTSHLPNFIATSWKLTYFYCIGLLVKPNPPRRQSLSGSGYADNTSPERFYPKRSPPQTFSRLFSSA